MQRLEVSGAVRPLYGSLGVKGLSITLLSVLCILYYFYYFQLIHNYFIKVYTTTVFAVIYLNIYYTIYIYVIYKLIYIYRVIRNGCRGFNNLSLWNELDYRVGVCRLTNVHI